MPQPEYVPIRAADEVRPVERLPAPRRWRPDRPADLGPGARGRGRGLGVPGPDQGYGLLLAHRFSGRLLLAPGESEHDAVTSAVAVALKRAALFGRAPVTADLELAFGLLGYLGEEAPEDLVSARRRWVDGSAHQYWQGRDLADRVPDETLRLTPLQVQERLASWRDLIRADPT